LRKLNSELIRICLLLSPKLNQTINTLYTC